MGESPILCMVRSGGHLMACRRTNVLPDCRAWDDHQVLGELVELPARGWYDVPEGATRLLVRIPGTRRTIGWELPEGVDLGPDWPRTLSVAEYDDRADDDDVDETPPELRLYRRVVEETEERGEVYELPEPMDVDAPPVPVPAGMSWKAELPHALREHQQLHQFFPGQLDVGRVLLDEAAKLPHVSVYEHKPSVAYVVVHNPKLNKRSTKEVQLGSLLTRPIAAPSLAEAVALIPERRQAIGEALKARLARICPHCDGEGLEFPT